MPMGNPFGYAVNSMRGKKKRASKHVVNNSEKKVALKKPLKKAHSLRGHC